jgi:hypothetical protein
VGKLAKTLDEASKLGSLNFKSSQTPDVMTKQAIDQAAKRFHEVFNKRYLGDVLRLINNAGRYGNAERLSVDTVPTLITKHDQMNTEVLQSANMVLEGAIDTLIVSGGLARRIPILVGVQEKFVPLERKILNSNNGTKYDQPQNRSWQAMYQGRPGKDVNSAKDCSIFRGTRRSPSTNSLLVEMNKAYNPMAAAQDIQTLTENMYQQREYGTEKFKHITEVQCMSGGVADTKSLWGGNSVLEKNGYLFSPSTGSTRPQRSFNLYEQVAGSYTGIRQNIYDVRGAREVGDVFPMGTVPNDNLLPGSGETLDWIPLPYSTGSYSSMVFGITTPTEEQWLASNAVFASGETNTIEDCKEPDLQVTYYNYNFTTPEYFDKYVGREGVEAEHLENNFKCQYQEAGYERIMTGAKSLVDHYTFLTGAEVDKNNPRKLMMDPSKIT